MRGRPSPASRESASDNVAAVGIRQEGQVAESLAAVYVCDVGHHQHSCTSCHQLGRGVQQVGPDAVVMDGVRRPGPVALLAQHQAVGAQNVVEAVAPKDELHAEVLTAEFKELTAACLWKVVGRTDVVAVEHEARDEDGFLVFVVNMLVIAPA